MVEGNGHKQVKVYLASPLGFTEEGRLYIRDRLLPALEKLKDIENLDPWQAVLGMDEKRIGDIALTLRYDDAMGYGWHNFNLIDKADIVLACLNGPDPDSGTCIEIGYACRAGKLVVGYRTDTRIAGECKDLLVNLQVEAAIEKSGGKIFRNLDAAVAFIEANIRTNEAIRSKVG